jgi:homopolymeric O-antigen transport system ATP-binding protein
MEKIITVRDISKRYQIGGLNPGYATFRESLAGAITRPIERLRRTPKSHAETIWALQDINFEVEAGEILGLIGHNGAGKSTLLKILSRITVPTTGRTEVRGRIGTLLEVGTGFHPDLTGRENIYLNGTILGISRNEVKRRFDEIVAFSEIESFIDTPVKWYSSGMYLRLAFAVAVHLDTEVLIMDEVLAVGDVTFQQKCLDKMHQIRHEGRTILFVSHSMTAVTRLCDRAILLDRGRMTADGPATEVVNGYLGSSWKVTAERNWPTPDGAPGNHVVRFRSIRVLDEEGCNVETLEITQAIYIELVYDVLQSGSVLSPKIDLINEEGAHLFSSHDVGSEWRQQPRPVGQFQSIVRIPANLLSEGNMLVHASVVSYIPSTAVHVHVSNVVGFQVVDKQLVNSARGDARGPFPGAVRPLLEWTTRLKEKQSADESVYQETGAELALQPRE